MHIGTQHQVLWAGQRAGLPLEDKTIADHLSARGYTCHAIGKWHTGFYSWEHTPTFRGFDSFLGFYGGGEDYFTHTAAGGSESPGTRLSSGYDFRWDATRNCGAGCSRVLWSANTMNVSGRAINGSVCAAATGSRNTHTCESSYSTTLFAERAVQIVETHDTSKPLFVYLAFQAVHAPDEVPSRYIDGTSCRSIKTKKRQTFCGMLNAADEGVGNITKALVTRTMDQNLIVVVTTDNGGPNDQGPHTTCPPLSYCLGTGTSNWPLRGGKHTIWEGGLRGVSMIKAPGLAAGTKFIHLVHVSDWIVTLLSAIGKPLAPSVLASLDGVDHWQQLSGKNKTAARQEVWLFADPLAIEFPKGTLGDAPKSAIRVGDYKLILGPPGCPSSRIPPYQYDLDRLGDLPTQPTPSECRKKLDVWCSIRSNCPLTQPGRKPNHCAVGQTLYALKSLAGSTASGCKAETGSKPEWRCYAANNINANHSAYDKGCCYCTRPELGAQFLECLNGTMVPDDPPAEGGDCIRDGANSTRLCIQRGSRPWRAERAECVDAVQSR